MGWRFEDSENKVKADDMHSLRKDEGGFHNSWIRRLTGGIITHSSIDEAVLYQRTKIVHEPMKTNIWIEDDVFEVCEQKVRYPALDKFCHKRYFPRKTKRHVTASARKICTFICSWNACK